MDAKQTPLIELLERVPHNERCRVDEPDGMGSVFIPVGRLCHEAATSLRKRQTQPQRTHWEGCEEVHPECRQQEPVAWRNAALRVGEDLCSVGPFGYYDMTAQQWLDWALSVVTCHPPQRREWVGLTEAEKVNVAIACGCADVAWMDFADAVEAKLREKNA